MVIDISNSRRQILADGSRYNPMVEICTYLDDTRLSEVSHDFRRSNRVAMVVACKRLLNLATTETSDLPPEELRAAVTAVFQRVSGIISEIPTMNQAIVDLDIDKNELTRVDRWRRLSSQIQESLRDEGADSDERLWAHLLKSLQVIDGVLVDYLDRRNLIEVDPIDTVLRAMYEQRDLREIFRRLNDSLRDGLAPFSVSSRFKTVAFFGGNRPLDYRNPDEVTSCLAALRQNQRTVTALSPESGVRFNVLQVRHKYNFSPVRFLQQEQAALEGETIIDQGYIPLWRSISREFQNLGIDIGPNPPRSPAQVKEWLYREENSVHLQRIERLRIYKILEEVQIPAGIETLPNLRELSVDSIPGGERHNLNSLPLEIANLTRLEKLELRVCSFRHVPEIVQRIPSLRELDLRYNQIEEIPHFLATLPHLRVNISNPIRALQTVINPVQAVPVVNIPRVIHEQVRQLPFRSWFEENIRVPYAPWSIDFGSGLFESVKWGIYATFSLCYNTLAFFLNGVLLGIVEPITRLIRRCLGYADMVDVGLA